MFRDKNILLTNKQRCIQGGGGSDTLPLDLEWIIFHIVFDVNFESIKIIFYVHYCKIFYYLSKIF